VIRKLILAALVLPLLSAAVVLPSKTTARASSGWDIPSLTKQILTKAEFTSAVGAIQDTADADPVDAGDGVIVGRYFTSSDGEVMTINLLGAKDGSAPTGDDLQSVLNGDFIEQWTKAVFSSVDNVVLVGTLNKNRDFMAQFTGTLNGTTLNYSAISFVKGNVVGILYYGTPGDNNDGAAIGSAYGAQYSKLP
jgi:hypothetical protein